MRDVAGPQESQTATSQTKTAIIGGGQGCRAILQLLAEGRLTALNLDVICVVDPNQNSVGMSYARELGILTTPKIEKVLEFPNLKLVIELTGSDAILAELYRIIPTGVKVIDHTFARVFWDLNNVEQDLRKQLREKVVLEERLRRDRKKLQDIINSLGDVIIVMDRDLAIEAVNAEFTKITGLGPSQITGDKCRGVVCEKLGLSKGTNKTCPAGEALKTGIWSRSILSTMQEDGEEAYYEVSAKPIVDEEGRIIRCVETFHRITEQVLLKRETKESVQRFQQFIDSAHDLILMKDLEGRYMVINPSAANLFRLEPRDFIGKTDKELFDPKLAERLREKDREVLQNRRHICHEETLVLGGTRHHLNTVRFPLLDYKGDCTGLCSISRDITAQRQLQKSLIQSEKLAALGKLAAGVAHEINNPLSGILAFVEDLLIDVDPDDPVRRDYEVILREALRCRQIVKDLLDYSRVQKPVRHPNDINLIVQRVLSIVSKQAAFRNIEFDVEPSSIARTANIDSSQMQQVILNLVMNAADAMNARGTIRISTGYIQEANEVFLAVSDHGSGIPEENLKKIFEPFFSTKGSKGNGLGLPVVSGIVERHGGRIDIQTAVSRGTTFEIRLPACEA